MPGDVLSGRYPLTDDFWKILGQPVNASQPNIPVRSNGRVLGLGNLTDEAAALVSGEITLLAVPVEVGDQITLVDFFVGATPGSTLTHQWAAIYSGTLTTAVLQNKQSADITTATLAASTTQTLTLPSGGVPITSVNAPYGYVYVAISFTGTVPSLTSAVPAAACQYAWYPDMPLLAALTGSAVGATAPSTLTLSSGSASLKAAIVGLR